MWIATAVATLRIEVSETMRRAPPRALVREVATRTMRVERDGSSLAVAFPMRLVTTDDVVLADAFATGADGYVVRVRLTADPASASRGGCRALVRALVATITPTRVRLDRRARSLAFAGLRVDLPFGLASHVEPGPDFDILRVSEPGSWLGIYDGNFPHRFHEGGPSFTREVLGETVSVFDARRHGTHHREFIVDLHDGSFRHVLYGAGDEAGFARMEAIAASIRAPDARSSQ